MTKEIYDITDLYEAVKINDELKEENHNLCKELERYKNIIDKLETYLKEIPNNNASGFQYGRESLAEDLQDLIKELKGE